MGKEKAMEELEKHVSMVQADCMPYKWVCQSDYTCFSIMASICSSVCLVLLIPPYLLSVCCVFISLLLLCVATLMLPTVRPYPNPKVLHEDPDVDGSAMLAPRGGPRHVWYAAPNSVSIEPYRHFSLGSRLSCGSPRHCETHIDERPRLAAWAWAWNTDNTWTMSRSALSFFLTLHCLGNWRRAWNP